MTPDRWLKINSLLDSLLEISPADREGFIDKACAGDQTLRGELVSLLQAHDESESFLETMPHQAVASLFPSTESKLGSSLAHYQLLNPLGAGGMSEVFLARDLKLGRLVALKVLPAHTSDQKRIDRFRQEACAASALNHPNILTVYEIGEQAGCHFIVTEYVEGETLRQQIRRGGVPAAQAIEFASQVAGALIAAHNSGIVHRDIKPENIMIRPDQLIKVLDFGIAKLLQQASAFSLAALSSDSSPTDPGVVIGTVHYMSPEQVSGREIDARSDLFSLGVVLYEMLAGVRPFTGDTPGHIAVALVEQNPPPLSTIVRNAPAELERILAKALAKSPDDRYQTAAEFLSDLKSLARNRAELETREGGFDALTRPISPHQTLTTPSASQQTERRPATIVYATVSGCAAIVEELDPLEAKAAIDSIQERVKDLIASHGGFVNRCEGEEISALFGVPFSDEDDYLRAVQTSVSLKSLLHDFSRQLESQLGQRLQISIGVSSGPVVIQPDQKDGYTVSGSALQVASRLAALATADEILLSPETYRLTAPYFRLSEKGLLSLKPGDSPMMVYRVEGESGVRTRLEAAEIAGLTPYTGRDQELAALLASLQQSTAGEGQCVTVVGDAGLGKSRLLLEFRRAIESQAITLLQGRCQPHRATAAYGPFIEILRSLLGLSASDASRSKAAAAIRNISEDLESYLPIYLHLLSMHEGDTQDNDLHGENLRFAIREALAAILTLYAKQEPTVLLLEDWHWADEGSIEALKRLSGFAPSYPLMIVVACRPDAFHTWRAFEAQTTLQLQPLDAISSTRIVCSVLGVEVLPEGLGDHLHRLTGGNPFFIEEVCRTLVEEARVEIADGAAHLQGSLETLQLPDTIQTVIRTRLDRLDPDSQVTLRRASVLGREFTLALLERMLEGDGRLPSVLVTLERHGLIRQVRIAPEPAYRFKHALTQEVVYESLLARQRKTLHGAAGNAIEELYVDRLEEHLEILTYHFSRAEQWSKAVQYGRESAQKASGFGRFSEALSTLVQTEGWLTRLQGEPESTPLMVRLLLEQERLCETLARREQQQALIDRSLALAEISEDRALFAEALIRQGELYTLLGRFEEAEAALTESLSIKRSTTDADGERLVLRNMGFLYWQTGRYEDAIHCNNAALAIDQAQHDSAGYAKDLTNRASILRTQGRSEEALAYLKEAFDINDTLSQPVSQVYTMAVLANVYRDLDETELAMQYFKQADEIAVQRHLPLHRIVLLSSMAGIRWGQGRVEESLALCNDLTRLTRSHGVRKELARSLETLSEHLLALDRFEEALLSLREAAEVSASLGNDDDQARMLSSLAYICERRSRDGAQALSAWEKVRTIKQSLLDTAGEIEALESMARVARSTGNDPDYAIECLRQAQLLAEQIGDDAKTGALLNSIAIIEWGRGEYPAALRSYEQGLQIFEGLDDNIHSGLMLNSIGVTLNRLGRHEEAIQRLEAALRLHRESGQQLLESHALAALGDVYRQTGANDRACIRYAASLEIRRERRDRKGEGWMLHRLAAALTEQGDLRTAQERLLDADAIADELMDEPLKQACRSLRDLLR
jgi:serine/threonine protein kinase/tetratricopeptide (TPR) repeat protein